MLTQWTTTLSFSLKASFIPHHQSHYRCKHPLSIHTDTKGEEKGRKQLVCEGDTWGDFRRLCKPEKLQRSSQEWISTSLTRTLNRYQTLGTQESTNSACWQSTLPKRLGTPLCLQAQGTPAASWDARRVVCDTKWCVTQSRCSKNCWRKING